MHTLDHEAWLTYLGCIGLVLFASTLALSPLVVLIVERIFPGRNVVFARWGFSHVVVVAALICAVLYAGALFIPHGEAAEANALITGFATMALAMGSGCVLVASYAKRFSPDGLRALGLWRGRHFQAMLAGWTAYVLLLPGLIGLLMAWSWIQHLVAPDLGMQPVLKQVLELPHAQRWLAVLFGVLVLPLFEEILFRVFLQPLLVQNLRDRGGVTLTALVFALLHGPEVAVPVFALALILGSIMLRTQRLAAVWSVHALHNGLVFAIVFVFPEVPKALEQTGLLVLF